MACAEPGRTPLKTDRRENRSRGSAYRCRPVAGRCRVPSCPCRRSPAPSRSTRDSANGSRLFRPLGRDRSLGRWARQPARRRSACRPSRTTRPAPPLLRPLPPAASTVQPLRGPTRNGTCLRCEPATSIANRPGQRPTGPGPPRCCPRSRRAGPMPGAAPGCQPLATPATPTSTGARSAGKCCDTRRTTTPHPRQCPAATARPSRHFRVGSGRVGTCGDRR